MIPDPSKFLAVALIDSEPSEAGEDWISEIGMLGVVGTVCEVFDKLESRVLLKTWTMDVGPDLPRESALVSELGTGMQPRLHKGATGTVSVSKVVLEHTWLLEIEAGVTSLMLQSWLLAGVVLVSISALKWQVLVHIERFQDMYKGS